ncbi:HNH endonuclease [Saccharospirillum salsuginis]|uniref:HNH endonuclease n=1 Tax=Saccharospirillum salsuginis TaxID=418750 RepID=UPI001673EA46|nr:HNH endonuclease signature motif containing protein [Saccharospirillum salsuginis]
MPFLDEIKPSSHNRVYDLVRDAGIDVSDWEESKGNASSAASNPKYCYNWSFVKLNEIVVLNLWHNDLEETSRGIINELNPREFAKREKGVTVRRAKEMDEAIQEAYLNNLPVRVILCDGTRRIRNDPNSKASKVQFRSLDPEPWHVSEYRVETGKTTLMRGLGSDSDNFVDQFDLAPPVERDAKRCETKSFPFVRRAEVRRYVLVRANGKCEYCGAQGFTMANGRLYLETHHVIPLHDNGPDSVENVVALCPNHHREAHHGKCRDEIRLELQEKLALLVPYNQRPIRSP